MRQATIIDNKSKDLILIFGGWAVDEHLFSMLRTSRLDISLVYDYRDCWSFDPTQYSHYTNIRVIAWSMGVFEAATTLYNTTLPITESLAINGTLYPIDDQLGIAESIYRGTLHGLNATNLSKFRIRMCGGRSHYQAIEPYLPHRDIEDLKQELAAIEQHYLDYNGGLMRFDKALISLEDLIFSPANQTQAWQKEGVAIDTISEPHWPNLQPIIDGYE